MNKKVLALVIVFVLFTISATAFAMSKEEASKWYYGNASSWAQDELVDAVVNGLIMDADLLQDCKRDITRKEFSTLAVNLYRAIKMEDPAPAPISTFSDTTDLSIRIAYNLGIINGVGQGKFAPDSSITREQMGVIMLNAVNALGVKYNRGDGKLVMNDKGNVSAWAVEGVDFVYENDFMKGDGIKFSPKDTTPVEQSVVIVNRVYKEYSTPVITEADNYTKGYTSKLENNGLYVQFNNTGNKKAVVKYGEKINPENDASMKISKASNIEITNNYQKIYFMDQEGRIISYDFKTDKYYNYQKDFGFASGYSLMEKGKYKGYFIVREKGTNGAMIAYDTKLQAVGPVYDMDPYTAEHYIDAAYNFSFEVEGEKYYNMATYGGSWGQGKTLSMSPSKSSDGPIALVANQFEQPIIYNNKGYYQVSMKFKDEENSNAGIVFNVTRASVGNDQYTGYYVGISPERNSVMVGWANNSWNKLEEVELDFDVKKGKIYTLEVYNYGEVIDVYVEGNYCASVENNLGLGKGYIGVRGWRANVEFESFSAGKLPY